MMIFPAIGVPGRFAEQCENLLCRLAAVGGADPLFFGANSLQELGARLLPADRPQAVMVVRHPRSDMAQAILAADRPFLIALEEPEACVAALMQDHGSTFLDAVRSVASALSMLRPLMGSCQALILRSDASPDLAALAAAIAAHFGLQLDGETVQAVAASVDRDLPRPGKLPAPVYRHAPEPLQSFFEPGFGRMLPDLMAGALQPAWNGLRGQEQEAVWHRDLFLSSEQFGPPDPVMDITGLARCLFYGPYIHLPPGSWSCSLTLGCSRQTVGLKLTAEIASASVLGRVSFEISEPGFFEIEFSCVLPSQDHPVEIRLFNAEAAFEGHIALLQATMRPLRAVRIPVKPV